MYNGWICFFLKHHGTSVFPSRGPVRIGKSLQLVELSVPHVKLTLPHLETSHPLTQQHLKCSPALLTPVLPQMDRRVERSRLSPLWENTEGHLTPCMALGTSPGQRARPPTLTMPLQGDHCNAYASKYLNSLLWNNTHTYTLTYSHAHRCTNAQAHMSTCWQENRDCHSPVETQNNVS